MTTYIQIPVDGGGSNYWIDAVVNFAALPTPGPVDGAVALTLDTNLIWRWDAGTTTWVGVGTAGSGFVGGFAVVSTAGGIAESLVTTTELGYVAGVTSAIQTQLNARLPLAGGTMTGTLVLAGAPVGANDAVTLAYLQSTVEGFSPKLPALVSTTANIALTGEQTLDGVLTSASRVLVRFQTAPAENGIYVSAAGAWARASDMNSWAEVPTAFVIVQTGTLYGDTGWLCTSNAGGTLGTTAITWGQWFGVGTYTADGTYVALTGSQFSLSAAAATSIDDVQAATSVNTASTIVKRDASGNFAAGTITAALTGNASGSAASFTGSLVGDVTGTQGATVAATMGGKTAAEVAQSVTDTIAATSVNTASTIVERDASGNFAAGTITSPAVQGVAGAGTNIAGGDHTIAGGTSTGSASGGSVIFQTAPAGSSGAGVNAAVTRMRILSSGNVGIGPTSPTAPLEVSTTTVGSFAIAQLFASSNSGGGNKTILRCGVNSSTNNSGEMFFTYSGSGSTNNALGFGLPGIVVMTLQGSGNVGIGTTTIGSKLQVNGSAAIGYSSSTAAPTNGLAVAGSVGIGNSAPSNTLDVTGGVTATSAKFGATGTVIASAALEVSSTTKAFYPPRMTTAQRTAISAVNGAMIYNTDTDRFEGYAAGAWTPLHGWGS